jgi:hypothetical protein
MPAATQSLMRSSGQAPLVLRGVPEEQVRLGKVQIQPRRPSRVGRGALQHRDHPERGAGTAFALVLHRRGVVAVAGPPQVEGPRQAPRWRVGPPCSAARRSRARLRPTARADPPGPRPRPRSGPAPPGAPNAPRSPAGSQGLPCLPRIPQRGKGITDRRDLLLARAAGAHASSSAVPISRRPYDAVGPRQIHNGRRYFGPPGRAATLSPVRPHARSRCVRLRIRSVHACPTPLRQTFPS